MKLLFCSLVIMLINSLCAEAKGFGEIKTAGNKDKKTGKEYDVYQGKNSEIKITFVGHGSLMVENQGKVYHIDPWSNVSDYLAMPKADIILVTHEHFDHYDAKILKLISKKDTKIICSPTVYAMLDDKSQGQSLGNGERVNVDDLAVEAIPAYNIEHLRDGKNPFHPKGIGNGYILTVDGLKIYAAGDTENVPEMERLGKEKIDVAFLPFNLPYTMDKEMFLKAADMIKPRNLYPYHTMGTSKTMINSLEKAVEGVNIFIRTFN